jgi:phosphatidylserine/phosphatidylglycerophosphate/cardiolipin synthase-like enzyme
MHIKIQLSEQGRALFSSGNISSTSYERWREFSVLASGNIVLALWDELVALGIASNPEHRLLLENAVKIPLIESTALGYLSFNPALDPHPLNPVLMSQRNTLTDYLVDRFDSARDNVMLTTLYFKPAPALLDAILRASRRGVRIEIFHSHRNALGPSIIPWIPSYHLYTSLLDAGVRVYENIRGDHSKVLLFDDRLAVFGSYNLEYAAHDRIAEAMMISERPEHTRGFRMLFDQLRQSQDNTLVAGNQDSTPASIRLQAQALRPLRRWL